MSHFSDRRAYAEAMTLASESPALAIGDYIRIARRRAGMEQSELAREVGAARATMSNWETGRSEPSFSAVVRIAQATGVALDWFVQGALGRAARVSESGDSGGVS